MTTKQQPSSTAPEMSDMPTAGDHGRKRPVSCGNVGGDLGETGRRWSRFRPYAAVALAGLGDLPDTIMTRSVVIRMRRRAPDEHVQPFRHRVHAGEGHELRDRLTEWTTSVATQLEQAWPVMPDGVTDRPADVWEPLLAIADAAGRHWPGRARAACVELVAAARSAEAGSLGLRLLADLRAVFGSDPALPTDTILQRLRELPESPWSDLKGKPLDARGLAYRLRRYDVGPHQYRDALGLKTRGYSVAGSGSAGGLGDAWGRYLPPPQESGTAGTAGTGDDPGSSEQLPLVPDNSARTGTAPASGTGDSALTSGVPAVPAVPLPAEREADAAALQLLRTELGAHPIDPAGCPDCEPERAVSGSLLTGEDGLQRCRRHHFQHQKAR